MQPNAQHGPKVPNRASKADPAKAPLRSNYQTKFPMVVHKGAGPTTNNLLNDSACSRSEKRLLVVGPATAGTHTPN